MSKENCEEHPRINLASTSSVTRSQEDYKTQVSEEIEGRFTKKLSQEISRTENRILGALARLDDFLMNPLLQGHSGTTPKTSRKVFSINQGANEDDSQSDPHPEAGLLTSGREDRLDMATGVQRESTQAQDMVTGVTEQTRNQRDIITGVHEEFMCCSPSTSSGKQKKNRSTSQPQFCSENTPVTIEADQFLFALQQLANNNNSANFHNKTNRIYKLPKSLKTTMPTFDGKSENFELFEHLFQTSLKIHNQLTEEDRINYFHSLMRGDALQTFKNINGPTRDNLGEILAVFRRKNVKPQSMATAKHKFQKLVFNPANQKLVDFLDELQKLAKEAFGFAAHAIIEQFIYAKMPPHLKKSINQAHLENGTYEQIVTHLERELELNGLEAPDELQINTVTHITVNENADRTKPTCHYCKKPGYYKNQCQLLKKQREQTENNQNNPGNKSSDANTSNPNGNVNNPNNNNRNSNRPKRKPKTVYPPCETCGKTNHSTERCYHGANAANRQRRPERQNQVQERAVQDDSNDNSQAVAQNLNLICHVFTPELRLSDRRQLI